MLQLYPSNKTESLAYLIAEIIDRHPLEDVFDEDIILIQSQGMGTWLQQELSSHSGISGLLKCQMPASFIWQLAERLMPEDRHIPIFEKNNARWEILKQLPNKIEEPDFLHLKNYLISQQKNVQEPDKQSSQQKVLFELSCLIADIFDAYQNYRPDWIETWESGKSILDSSLAHLNDLEHWQSDLWRSLYPEIALDQRRHRSRLFQKLISLLHSPSETLKHSLPKRLFIFGLSALPPQWLPLVSALSKHVDIHFFVHNPCQYYWGDVLTSTQQLKLEKALVEKGVSTETAAEIFLEGNPLLASWGKLGRDYLSLLTDSSDIKDAPTSLFDDTNHTYLTMLHYIQDDILKLQVTHRSIKHSDDSIRFASCHSHLREVEALHDYLFSLMNQHSDIKPKDIIVMMPDVQDFAALIEAVFSRPAFDVHGQAQYLPYGISDQLLSMDQPLLDTLSGLLGLSGSRITGVELLDWLEMPAIRSRFSISEPEMEDVKEWIHQLNVRWGLSEKHRDTLLNVNGSGEANTWFTAAQRLLAGYIFGDDDIYQLTEQEILAFPQRSPEKQILVGKVMHMLDTIERSIYLQSKQFSLEEWLQEISSFWKMWLDFEWVSADIQLLLSEFQSDIEKEIAQTGFNQPVSFSVIASILKSQFEGQRVSQRFLAGKINFCTLMPMRSIPFKIVCMLGLNEGAYPRPDQGQSFDLLTLTPSKTGDRSRRDDDRYLFLEAICSARSHLYISYCGKDIQDNSERYPSILVTELQNYCSEYFTLEDREFEKDETILDYCQLEHHLQPFHQAYYFSEQSNNATLNKTFAREWLPLINPDIHKPQLALETDHKAFLVDEEQLDLFQRQQNNQQLSIDFERLLMCVSHPLRFYYQSALLVNLQGFDEEMRITEPFSIQGLDAYDLKKDLVQSWFDDHKDDELFQIIKRWQLAGSLPRAPLDIYYTETIQAGLKPMFDYVCSTISEESLHHEFIFELDKYEVSGNLVTHGNQLVEMSLGKKLGSSFFGFWLKHIFWSLQCVHSEAKASRLIGPQSELLVPLLSKDIAEKFALESCLFFETASVEPQVFFAKSTYALLFESEAKAKAEFKGNQYFAGEAGDLYWQRFSVMKPETLELDQDGLPDFQKSIFFKQVESIKDKIQINKIESNTGAAKQELTKPEAQT